MAVGSLRDLSWNLAIIFGWLAVISLGYGWYARWKFQVLLKLPLTEEAEHLAHVWEQRVTRWTTIGVASSGLSILCFVAWLLSGVIL